MADDEVIFVYTMADLRAHVDRDLDEDELSDITSRLSGLSEDAAAIVDDWLRSYPGGNE